MSEKIVLITDYTWPSTDPEAEVLARIGAKILVAQSGAEEELLELVPAEDDDPPGPVALEDRLHAALAEGTCSSRHQHALSAKVVGHHLLL